MHHSRNARVVASDLPSHPVAISKPMVQVLPYDSSLGKSSPDSTNKTMDASSCTSWSECSSPHYTDSRGSSNFGEPRRNTPTLATRSSLDLESVNEDDTGEDSDQVQEEVSVITNSSKSAETDDHLDKDELIARLSMQVAVLQQKVSSIDQQKTKKTKVLPSPSPGAHSKTSVHARSDGDDDQQPPQPQLPTLATVPKRGRSVCRFSSDGCMEKSIVSSSMSHESLIGASDGDDDEQLQKQHFPTLATVSKPEDLRSKFAKRGKSVRRFSSDGCMEKHIVSSSMSHESLIGATGDVSNTYNRGNPRKQRLAVPQSSLCVQQAQLDLQKSFSMRGRNSRGFGLSTSGALSMCSYDSRGSQSSSAADKSGLRRGGSRSVPSSALEVEISSESSTSESSDSDSSSKSPTMLRQAFAMMKQVQDPVSRECEQQQHQASMETPEIRRTSAMKGQSVRNLYGRSKTSVSLQETTSSSFAANNDRSSDISSIAEDKDKGPLNLREAWQSTFRKESATVTETVSNNEVSENKEMKQRGQDVMSFNSHGSDLLEMVTEETENSETFCSTVSCTKQESSLIETLQRNSSTAMASWSNYHFSENPEYSYNIENDLASPSRKINLISEPRITESSVAFIDESERSSMSQVFETSDTDNGEAAQLAWSSKKHEKGRTMAAGHDHNSVASDANGKGDDDISWSPSDFATDEAFQQSHSSFASVSSSCAYLEGLPHEVSAPSKTMKMKMKARRRASFGILNERSADRDMTRVLGTLEGSFRGMPDDSSIDSTKKSKLANITKAPFRLQGKGKTKNEEESATTSSNKRGVFLKLISIGRKSKREASTGGSSPSPGPDELDTELNSIDADLPTLGIFSTPRTRESQFESSLLSIGYSSADSSVFYESFGSLDEAPKTKPVRSVATFKFSKNIFDVSRSGGEFEDLWKSKVHTGLDLSIDDGDDVADEAETNAEAWETLMEGTLQDSFRRPEIALDEVQRAIDRARAAQFEYEHPIGEMREQIAQKPSKSVCFNLLLEEENEVDRFHPVSEVPSEETKTIAFETANSYNPPRPVAVSPVQKFRRPRHGRLKATDMEAQQMTLVDL